MHLIAPNSFLILLISIPCLVTPIASGAVLTNESIPANETFKQLNGMSSKRMLCSGLQLGNCATFFDLDGDSFCLYGMFEELEDLRQIGWNDRISSVRIQSGCEVYLYEHIDYQGAIISRNATDPSLDIWDLPSKWDDIVSSIRCLCPFVPTTTTPATTTTTTTSTTTTRRTTTTTITTTTITTTSTTTAITTTTTPSPSSCSHFTVASCSHNPEDLIDSFTVNPNTGGESECQKVCVAFDGCQYFRYHSSTRQCDLYKYKYLDSCQQVGGLASPDIDECLGEDDNNNSCESFIQEDCVYTGGIALNTTIVANSHNCQHLLKYCEAEYFVYDSDLNMCSLYETQEKDCQAISGPTTPLIEDCVPTGGWSCFWKVPKCIAKCHTSNVHDWVKCTKECAPDCHVCEMLRKVSKKAGDLCFCSKSLRPAVHSCHQQYYGNWPGTIECILGKVSSPQCISILCDVLQFIIPEAGPEVKPICNCVAPIVGDVATCHQQHGEDWEKVVVCAVKKVGHSCKKYLCKFAGKLFPPIKKTGFCRKMHISD